MLRLHNHIRASVCATYFCVPVKTCGQMVSLEQLRIPQSEGWRFLGCWSNRVSSESGHAARTLDVAAIDVSDAIAWQLFR